MINYWSQLTYWLIYCPSKSLFSRSIRMPFCSFFLLLSDWLAPDLSHTESAIHLMFQVRTAFCAWGKTQGSKWGAGNTASSCLSSFPCIIFTRLHPLCYKASTRDWTQNEWPFTFHPKYHTTGSHIWQFRATHTKVMALARSALLSSDPGLSYPVMLNRLQGKFHKRKSKFSPHHTTPSPHRGGTTWLLVRELPLGCTQNGRGNASRPNFMFSHFM